MTELKPCPYCGEKPHLYTRNTWPRYLLRCDNCCAMDIFAHTEEKVTERWNRRAEKTALKIEKTKKKEELDKEKYEWRKLW